MKKLLRPFQVIYVLYAFATFIFLMLFVFIWAIIVSPFGKIRGGNLVYHACTVWADIWFVLVGIRHKNMYVEKPEEGKSYIYVSNHISYLDSAIIPKAFRKPVRPLGKVEMARIPVFGFIYRNAIVTVDRSSAENRTMSVQIMKSILRKGISILVFPEGTFNTTHQPLKDFYDGAFRIAIETGTPIKPVVLLDAYDRMSYTSIFTMNPGKSRAVFLTAIDVAGYTPEMTQDLKARVYGDMEKALVHYKAGWIEANRAPLKANT